MLCTYCIYPICLAVQLESYCQVKFSLSILIGWKRKPNRRAKILT
jgi:hypothetical protein